MRILLHLLIICLTAGVILANDSFVVTAGTNLSAKDAAELATSVSTEYHWYLEKSTLLDAPKQPTPGFYVSVFSPSVNSFSVSVFMGDSYQEAKHVRDMIIAAYPDALIHIPQAVESTDLYHDATSQIALATHLRSIVVLGSFKLFEAASAHAREVSDSLGIEYYVRSEADVISPQPPRRYNSCGSSSDQKCISVELSGNYTCFESGFYIVVGGIVTVAEESEYLALYKPVVPDAYVGRTPLYLGCLH